MGFDGNPNLVHICEDAGQITTLQNQAIGYGYTYFVVDGSCVLSTNNPDLSQDFVLFPNPNNGSFTITANRTNSYNSANITVVDLQGRVVYENNNATRHTNTNINLKNILQSGVYYLSLKSESKIVKTVKVLVE